MSAAKTLLRAPRPSKSRISIDVQYNLYLSPVHGQRGGKTGIHVEFDIGVNAETLNNTRTGKSIILRGTTLACQNAQKPSKLA